MTAARLIKCETCTRLVPVGLECSGPSPPTDMQKQGRQDYHCAWCKDLRVDGPRKRQSRTLDPVNAGQPTISDRSKRAHTDGDKAGDVIAPSKSGPASRKMTEALSLSVRQSWVRAGGRLYDAPFEFQIESFVRVHAPAPGWNFAVFRLVSSPSSN